MKALMRLTEKAYDMNVVEIPEPVVDKDNWVKVKVAYAGVCGGSDIKLMKVDAVGDSAKLKPPVILGHEASGIVVEVGKSVTRTKVGDKVVYETTVDNCGACRYCHSGDWNMCPSRKGLGSAINGSFAEYVIVPERNIRLLPENVSLKVGALAEPLACAYHIVYDRGHIHSGENIVIIGPGIIGLCCSLVALAAGAKVIMIGTRHSSHRLEAAKEFGCSVLTNDIDNLDERVRELCNGDLADISVDAIGSNQAFDTALHLVRKMGRIVIGGVPSLELNMYTVDMSYIYKNQLYITAGRSSRPSSWTGALNVLSRYPDKFEKLVSKCFPIEKWQEAFDATIKKDVLKAMIKFDI